MTKTIPVTVENFVRAESDLYFSTIALKEGGFGKFEHHRVPTEVENQTVVRENRDTLYSAAIFNLDAGPVTITLPEAGDRFISLQAISEDEYVPAVYYGAGKYTLTKEQVGTRYVLAGVRILINPTDPEDLRKVHSLQDAIQVEQASPGKFEVPNWDPIAQRKVREALLVLGTTLPDSKGMFGAKDQVDPVRHLVGAINNITAQKSADGSVVVQFGGCDGNVANCLPIMPGWNYTVRLYRPRAAVLNGEWSFPEPQPVQ